MADYSAQEGTIHRILDADEFGRLDRGLAATFHGKSQAGDYKTRQAFRLRDILRVTSRDNYGDSRRVVVVDIARVQRGKGAKRPQYTYFYTVRLVEGDLPERPWGVA